MKQTAYEIEQRAEQLLREAISIWRQSDYDQAMEGLEKDPVMKLLISAIACQADRFDAETERIVSEIGEEFARYVHPAESGSAIPATAVVETIPAEGIPSMRVDENTVFFLADTPHQFIPLLESTAYALRLRSVSRLDGRRWKVSLSAPYPIRKLTGLTFAVKDTHYLSLTVSIKGKPLRLVNPWEYADLPLNRCFAIDHMLYSRERTYTPVNLGMELFARADVRLYYVSPCDWEKWLPAATDQLDLTFEFQGIANDFLFDKSRLALNVVPLVNAQVRTATLTGLSPIVRIESSGFLHLLRPAEEQIFGQARVNVRRAMGDRFNRSSLLKLLQYLIDKRDTDYYAFAELKGQDSTTVIDQLRDILRRLREIASNTAAPQGVYLTLDQRDKDANLSVEVKYLTTDGAAVNEHLTTESLFRSSFGFDNAQTRQVSASIPGFDEIRGETEKAQLAKYQFATQNRIVTRADIKQFCLFELMSRYHIGKDLIKSIRIGQRPTREQGCGYEICVEILLADNLALRRGFAEMIPQVEVLMSRMIAVRSANIYPVNINIIMEHI